MKETWTREEIVDMVMNYPHVWGEDKRTEFLIDNGLIKKTVPRSSHIYNLKVEWDTDSGHEVGPAHKKAMGRMLINGMKNQGVYRYFFTDANVTVEAL